MQLEEPVLKSTLWLSVRLGLSIRTIERLRAINSPELPPHLVIGGSIRYDERQVNTWINNRLIDMANKMRATA
jgi:predicted DNA-binding transcriptional regulator AlpA